MVCIYDDFNIVNVSAVLAVEKPDTEALWWLNLHLASGETATCRFASTDARDEFYKRLIEAMEKGT